MASQPVVYLYESDHAFITSLVQENIRKETGGDLFGSWRTPDEVLIQQVTKPGPLAVGNTLDFTQDEGFQASCARVAFEQHGLEHLGTWHSHHQLHLPEPSRGDDHTFFTGLQRNQHNVSRVVCGIATISGGQVSINWFMYDLQRGKQRCAVELIPFENPLSIDLSPEVLRRAQPESPPAAATSAVPAWYENTSAALGGGHWRGRLAMRGEGGINSPPFLEQTMALCKAMPPQSTTMDAGAERFRLLYPEGAISFGREFRNDWKIEALSSQPHPPAAAFHDRATRVLLDVLARVAPTAAEPPGPGALNHSGNRQVDLVPLSSASSLQPAAAVPSLTRSGNALAGIEVPPLEALPSPDSHKALNVIFRVTLSSRYGAQEKVTLSSERWTLQLPMKLADKKKGIWEAIKQFRMQDLRQEPAPHKLEAHLSPAQHKGALQPVVKQLQDMFVPSDAVKHMELDRKGKDFVCNLTLY